MAMSSIASLTSLSVIFISERRFPIFDGFIDISGMSFGVVKTDLYCWVSMLAIFFGSFSYYFLLSKVLFYLYIFCIYLHI